MSSAWREPRWILVGLLWVCYVLNHADRQVVYTLFPALQKEFQLSDATLGLFGALFLWIYGVCSPFAGMAGDRWPKANLVTGSLALWSFITVLSGFAPNGSMLLACRAMLGVAESFFMPAAFALMANAHGPESRSRAVAIFATSQMVGVALGGSLSGYVADHLHWRVSFWTLGGLGLLYSYPLWRFLRGLPAEFSDGAPGAAASPPLLAGLAGLVKIPSLRVVTVFVAVATFGLYLVYTWLPTFLYDRFSLSIARAGFESSVYPQAGTLMGLFIGGAVADRFYRRRPSARFWIVGAALLGGAPSIYLLGVGETLWAMRGAAMAVGFFAGFIIVCQVPSAFDVVPATQRASTVGVLNLLGAIVSGFAPFLGGLARRSIGIGRLMGFASLAYVFTAGLVFYAIRRHFDRDHRAAQER